jgi:hypothetical protein
VQVTEGNTGTTNAVFTVIGDTLYEPNFWEDFRFYIKNPTNAVISTPPCTEVGRIVEDDTQPGISVGDVTAAEAGAGGTIAAFTVSLSGPSSQAVSVNYATENGTAVAGSDYTATAGALTFSPGEVSKSVIVPLISDSVDEPAETFFLNLTAPANATLARARGTGTILNGGGPQLLTEEDGQRSVALNSLTMIRGPFSPETPYNLASDKRTRIMLFARNIELQPGEDFTVVRAQAEDSQHRVYPLTVEFVGKVPGFNWLTQINVRLADELIGAEVVRVHIILRDVISNQVTINLKPPQNASP